MDAEQVNQVVEKLAEKVGVAAEKLQPLGEQVIREYQAEQVVMVIAFGAMLLAGLALMAQCVFRAPRLCAAGTATTRYTPEETKAHVAAAISIVLGCIGMLLGVAGVIQGVVHMGRACAPTYHCLKALMG